MSALKRTNNDANPSGPASKHAAIGNMVPSFNPDFLDNCHMILRVNHETSPGSSLTRPYDDAYKSAIIEFQNERIRKVKLEKIKALINQKFGVFWHLAELLRKDVIDVVRDEAQKLIDSITVENAQELKRMLEVLGKKKEMILELCPKFVVDGDDAFFLDLTSVIHSTKPEAERVRNYNQMVAVFEDARKHSSSKKEQKEFVDKFCIDNPEISEEHFLVNCAAQRVTLMMNLFEKDPRAFWSSAEPDQRTLALNIAKQEFVRMLASLDTRQEDREAIKKLAELINLLNLGDTLANEVVGKITLPRQKDIDLLCGSLTEEDPSLENEVEMMEEPLEDQTAVTPLDILEAANEIPTSSSQGEPETPSLVVPLEQSPVEEPQSTTRDSQTEKAASLGSAEEVMEELLEDGTVKTPLENREAASEIPTSSSQGEPETPSLVVPLEQSPVEGPQSTTKDFPAENAPSLEMTDEVMEEPLENLEAANETLRSASEGETKTPSSSVSEVSAVSVGNPESDPKNFPAENAPSLEMTEEVMEEPLENREGANENPESSSRGEPETPSLPVSVEQPAVEDPESDSKVNPVAQETLQSSSEGPSAPVDEMPMEEETEKHSESCPGEDRSNTGDDSAHTDLMGRVRESPEFDIADDDGIRVSENDEDNETESEEEETEDEMDEIRNHQNSDEEDTSTTEVEQQPTSSTAASTRRKAMRKQPMMSGYRRRKHPRSKKPKSTEEDKHHLKSALRGYALSWLCTVADSDFDKSQFEAENVEAVEEKLKEVRAKNCFDVQAPLSDVTEEKEAYRDDIRGMLDEVKKLTIPEPTVRRKTSERVDRVPSLVFTSAVYEDPTSTSAEKVIELGKNAYSSLKENVVKNVIGVPGEGRSSTEQKEIAYYESLDDFEVSKLAEGYHPVPIFTPKDASEATINQMTLAARTKGLSMFRSVAEVFGIDTRVLDPQRLVEQQPDYEIQVRRQLPQVETNFYFLADRAKQHRNQWGTYDIDNRSSLRILVAHLTDCFNLAETAYGRMCNTPATFDEILENLMKELFEIQMPVARETDGRRDKTDDLPKEAIMLPFGTNVELKKELFPAQAAELKKFPALFSVDGEDDLLRRTKVIIDGMNSPQMYIKGPRARTVIHLENNAAGSFNMNLGPGNCIWWAISPEHTERMTELIRNKGGKAAKSRFYEAAGVWPCEKDIKEAKIPLQKVIQRPGDIVLVGVAAYHFVQSEGYATNISWNRVEGTFNQLSMAALMNDHYLANNYRSTVPLEKIIWELAEDESRVWQRGEEDFLKLVKHMLFRSLAYQAHQVEYMKTKKLGTYRLDKVKDDGEVRWCGKCQQTLYNIVPSGSLMIDGREQDLILCWRCAKHSIKPVQVYTTYDMATLAESYDNFQKITVQSQ